MKIALLLPLALLLAPATQAQFDFGKLSSVLDTAKSVGHMAKGAAGIGPEEERVIGESVALEIIGKYGGLVRDQDTLQRVNLVGRAVALASSRPDLNWRFAVLNSATVNAFSAPDGYVFITRALYDLATSDDELAGILGHEIAHIAERHALKIVARGEFLTGATSLASQQSSDVRQLDEQLREFDLGVGKITSTLFETGFDPQTEFAADAEGRSLAAITGYAPGGLRAVLVQLQRHGSSTQRAFSTHPPLKERIHHLPDEPAPPAS
ncbi:MAG: M48 family metalloprotease [Opitutaceae bacterium]